MPTRSYQEKLRREEMKKFKIGDWVLFKRYAEFNHDETGKNRVLGIAEIIGDPWRGIVSGAVHRFTGQLKSEYQDAEDPAYGHFTKYLEVKNTLLLWEVKMGLTNKPYLCFSEDMTLLWRVHEIPTPDYKFPFKYCYFDEKQKKEMSDIMKRVPRDENNQRWK
jgi:hypothetical protein